MVSDYAPGVDAETSFKEQFAKNGGAVTESIRFPLANPDFAPFLQRAGDAKPDAIFVFVPSGQGGTFVKQYVERGLDKAGIKLIGPGDVTDDDLVNGMGDQIIGTVTAHFYSAAHPSPMNKAWVEAFKKANNGLRPNFMAVSGYDGMQLIYDALKKTGGKTDGDALIAAMKGMKWESPRGPISIDPDTRDIVQKHLHPQGREGRRRALQRRVRDLRGDQGPGQGGQEVARKQGRTPLQFALGHAPL
jgi:branched-chain amino acid transport system substrate-binding protein